MAQEAARIVTPPMSPVPTTTSDRPDIFSHVAQQGNTGGLSSRQQAPRSITDGGSQTPVCNFLQRLTPTREWWATIKHPKSPDKSPSEKFLLQYEMPSSTNSFELNYPEHLPNSPLCPKHPKYIGRGLRVCAYHGRKNQ